ncbi:MAG TPA: YsnF/AvaK domain-containing protein [Rhodopila sp.]|nr:YsnF/AvaK domain-containing protein [Rhodopila sp.]
MQTITAMFHDKSEAERVATTLRTDSSLGATNVRVLPETATGVDVADTDSGRAHETSGFMASLRNFFMPEEDRYGYAEGLRRGGYMVAADVDDAHAHGVMDLMEEAGAIDLDAEESRWRAEGWRGYEPSSGATAGGMAAGTTAAQSDYEATTIPPVPGSAGAGSLAAERAAMPGGVVPETRATEARSTESQSALAGTTATGRTVTEGTTGLTGGRTGAAGTEERIPLVEEQLRVGKRQVMQGRVRIRSYVVETPVNETVHLRDERVEVERRPVDRPLTGNEADPFREREVEATEMREEPVISKDARVREELVLHKSVNERDETVRDTVRRTEVEEDRGEGDAANTTGTVRNPGAKPVP